MTNTNDAPKQLTVDVALFEYTRHALDTRGFLTREEAQACARCASTGLLVFHDNTLWLKEHRSAVEDAALYVGDYPRLSAQEAHEVQQAIALWEALSFLPGMAITDNEVWERVDKFYDQLVAPDNPFRNEQWFREMVAYAVWTAMLMAYAGDPLNMLFYDMQNAVTRLRRAYYDRHPKEAADNDESAEGE